VLAAARDELAQFLRTRRAQLSPRDVGLVAVGARRTPGLRREEVAALARISATWYTYLEQGRDVHPSEQTLAAIARALRLSPAERDYLRSLALERVAPLHPANEVPAHLRSLLAHISDLPAYVKSATWNVLATNAIAEDIFHFGKPGIHYLAWLFGARARKTIVNWAVFARQNLGIFRADTGWRLQEPWGRELVAELSRRHREFRQWWGKHPVDVRRPTSMTLDHAHRGRLSLQWAALADWPGSECRLLLFTPADEVTRKRLRSVAPDSERFAPSPK